MSPDTIRMMQKHENEVKDSEFVNRMVEWSENEAPENFNNSFILSVADFRDRTGKVSQKQMESLRRIAAAFNIE